MIASPSQRRPAAHQRCNGWPLFCARRRRLATPSAHALCRAGSRAHAAARVPPMCSSGRQWPAAAPSLAAGPVSLALDGGQMGFGPLVWPSCAFLEHQRQPSRKIKSPQEAIRRPSHPQKSPPAASSGVLTSPPSPSCRCCCCCCCVAVPSRASPIVLSPTPLVLPSVQSQPRRRPQRRASQ